MSSAAEPCDVCGASSTLEPWLEVSLCGVYDRFIHRCRACGFRQVRPRLTAHELSRLYPADYFDATATVGYGDYAREAQRRARDAYFLTKRLRRQTSAGRVLEIGCALGFLLAPLKRAGWDVDGVDASAFATYYARTRFGLRITCGTLEASRFPDAAFDLVVQKDLLEHVSRPREHLLETRRIMRPGGEVWLITPNGEANLRPLQSRGGTDGEQLPLLDQGHLSFFAEAHLRRLFRECGFSCKRARVIGVRRGLRALGYLPGQRRFARLAGRTTETPAAPAPDPRSDDQRFEPLAARIDADVARRRRQLREWIPYFHYHRLAKRLDALPASSGLGYDFEFWLTAR